MKIAIDGPAGSGKSTIAKILSKKLGIVYVDTGAMYRAVALYCMQKGLDLLNEQHVIEQLSSIQIDIAFEKGTQHIYLNGIDVTETIRTQQAGEAASKVAKYKLVRDKVFMLQTEFTKYDCIMDGRDIGTVIMPFAELKIFLTASANERAQRRCNELKEKNLPHDYEEIKQEIIKRDLEDTTREISPLVKSSDAIELDTTGLTINEVVSTILNYTKSLSKNQ